MQKLFLQSVLIASLLAFINKPLLAQKTETSTFTGNSPVQKEINEQTYVITDNGSVSNIQPYIDALNNSDMKNHRLRDKRNTIVFKSGVKVELLSASEILKSGRLINPIDYPENFDAGRQEPIFALGANNFILEYHIASTKHN